MAVVVYDITSKGNNLDSRERGPSCSRAMKEARLIPMFFFLWWLIDRNSFMNTAKWIDDVRAERGTDVIIVLVGNKTDLNEKRQVTAEEGEKKAKEFNIMFIETSAKAGHNVKTLFRKIAQALPGMENTITDANQSQLIDVKIQDNPNSAEGANGCAC